MGEADGIGIDFCRERIGVPDSLYECCSNRRD